MRVQIVRWMGCHALAAILVFSATGAPADVRTPLNNRQNSAERILEMLEDTNALPRLSEQEERQHVERLRRLYELEKIKPQAPRIQEPAGSATITPDMPMPQQPTASADASMERLIEAIEQLQMEIRRLNQMLAIPPSPHGTNRAPLESEEREQPFSPQARR